MSSSESRWSTSGLDAVDSGVLGLPHGALDWGAVSICGETRSSLQDRIALYQGSVMVADGVGGESGGSVAADLAIDNFLEGRASARTAVELGGWIRQVDQIVRADDDAGATTLTVVRLSFVADEPRWLVANVGDSPAYLIRDGVLDELSESHSVVGYLVASGSLAPEAAADHPMRHVLEQAVGGGDGIDPSVRERVAHVGDVVVLSSDGVSRPSVLALCNDVTRSPLEMARACVQQSLAEGATDNVSIVVCRFREVGQTLGERENKMVVGSSNLSVSKLLVASIVASLGIGFAIGRWTDSQSAVIKSIETTSTERSIGTSQPEIVPLVPRPTTLPTTTYKQTPRVTVSQPATNFSISSTYERKTQGQGCYSSIAVSANPSDGSISNELANWTIGSTTGSGWTFTAQPFFNGQSGETVPISLMVTLGGVQEGSTQSTSINLPPC